MSSQKLVIVESPGKIKTIQRYLSSDFKVVSCFGHVRDLPADRLAIDIKNQFKPEYIVQADKKELLKQLKKDIQRAATIYLATDDDREGEAISWHLKEALHLSDDKIERIVFREITKQAIQRAMKSPRKIDMDRVDAQLARRTLDRLVGYLISPILYSKIRPSLSAGRVQSVAVKLITEREREIIQFKPRRYFKIKATFNGADGTLLEATADKQVGSEEAARSVLEKSKNAHFVISKIEEKPSLRAPSAPLTTSRLQQEASHKLGYKISRTMRLAQQLYEAGHISYPRTDSVRLSVEAQQAAVAFIQETYGGDYVQARTYQTKSAAAQEAHEAIRPTHVNHPSAGSTEGQKKLYQLIWERTVASQMAPAKLQKTTLTAQAEGVEVAFQAKGERVIFPGFLALNGPYKTKSVPPLRRGERIELDQMEARGGHTAPPPRYTEGSLVRALEERGIGRPSTYVPTIETIQKRGYIKKETRAGKSVEMPLLKLKSKEIERSLIKEEIGAAKEKLFPTDVALIVTDYLTSYFPQIINYDFTAQVEEGLDAIAQKKEVTERMLAHFYEQLEKQIHYARKSPSPASITRVLGVDPVSQTPVVARLSRKYGPMLQMGAVEGDQKPRFANLPTGKFLENITLEEALPLFRYPRVLDTFEEVEIYVKIGRFGPYIQHKGAFYSIKLPLKPGSITQKEAIALIEEERLRKAQKIIKTISKEPLIEVCNGRFGPYIKTVDRNYKIPKTYIPEKLDAAACSEIIAQAPAPKKRRGRFKRK